jgi:hypothetical protein
MNRTSLALLVVHVLWGCEPEQCPPTTREEEGYCVPKDAGQPAGEATASPSQAAAVGGASGALAPSAGSAIRPMASGQLDDGDACDDDDACASGHCSNGLCCEDGDCCATKYDCPDSYSAEAVCTDPAMCQGSRQTARCEEHICVSEAMDDDSACTSNTIAIDCKAGSDIRCNGQKTQTPPSMRCASEGVTPGAGTANNSGAAGSPAPAVMGGTNGADGAAGSQAPPEPVPDNGCSRDADCDAAEHCQSGQCVDDIDNGQPCTRSSVCQSGYCGNGICCASGRCCRASAECPSVVVCSDRSRCAGTRTDYECRANSCTLAATVDDNTRCVGQLADACGDFKDLVCERGSQVARCPMSCSNDNECDEGGLCRGAECLAKCVSSGDCRAGRACIGGSCIRRCTMAADCPDRFTCWERPTDDGQTIMACIDP